jgi:hypothetical protein
MSIFRKKPKNPFDEFKGKPLDEVPPEIRSKSTCLKMIFWVKACLLDIYADHKLALSPRAKLAVDIFFLGSIDYLCQCHNLDDEWYGITADEVFRTISPPFSELAGATLIINYNNFREHAFSSKILDDGFNLCQKWFSRENPHASMALWHFVNEWNETPELPKGLEMKDLFRYFWDHGGSQFINNASGDSE